MIKEAYGAEENGMQYVCIVLFRNSQRRLLAVGELPYVCGLLPATLKPETIPPKSQHLSVYKTENPISDPILAVLKKPSDSKWRWCSRSRAST
jgi:hypothetical protein